MAEYDRGQLLGYLLGALEPEEARAIDEQLERDPGLREELARVQAGLRPLRSVDARFRPPAGLAGRTCRMVSLVARPRSDDSPRAKPARPRARRMSPGAAPPTGSGSWTWTDMAVAMAVVVLAALAIFPALQNVRNHARLAACQDNLRQIGVHYHQATQRFPRALPNALPREPGSFGPASTAFHDSSSGQNVLFHDGRVLLICNGSGFLPGDDSFPFRAAGPAFSPNPESPAVTFVNDWR